VKSIPLVLPIKTQHHHNNGKQHGALKEHNFKDKTSVHMGA